jgi:hypothetical protein
MAQTMNQIREFHQESFLLDRLNKCDTLLSLVLQAIDSWGVVLSETSWSLRHSQGVMRSVSSLTFLVNALENALKFRASQNDVWWQANEPYLRESKSEAIRYFVIQAYKENIEVNQG